MKKIDILNSALAESGLTAEAVVKSWYENNQISAEFLQQLCSLGKKSWYENNQISAEFLQQLCPVGRKTTFQDMNFIPSKKFVTPKKIAPGMFYYADGLIFPELIKDSQVSAIVGCVDRNHGLALGLRETELPWSSTWLYVDMPSGLRGKEATSLILKTAKEKHENAEAAEWCAEYAFDGIKAGTGFIVLLRRRFDISGTDKRQSGFGNCRLCRKEPRVGFGIAGSYVAMVERLALYQGIIGT
ncbi:unknown [Proteobacteria bacterium CAG:495]|nr:unknown [Proteobacteria bacterium CAG:495]